MIEVSKGVWVIGGCVYDFIVLEYCDVFKVFNEWICVGECGELEFDIIGYWGICCYMEFYVVFLKCLNGDFV